MSVGADGSTDGSAPRPRRGAAKPKAASRVDTLPRRGLAEASNAPCVTCGGRTVLDHGVDVESGTDLIEECPDCPVAA